MPSDRSGNPTQPKTYHAIAERAHGRWVVRVDGLGSPGRFEARDLTDIEPRTLKLIWGCTGVDVDEGDLEIQLRLPGVIQDRLDVIRQHCDDIETEYDATIAETVEMGLPLLDISRILDRHHCTPRPLAITNAEIAEHGLDRHPDAIGVEWDDHGFARTRLCRRHVDSARRTYRDLDADGKSALVYIGIGFQCDRCHEGDD